MTRILVTAVIVLFTFVGVVAGDPGSDRTVNLNEPGAFEALRHDNPAHYEKIQGIMAGLFRRPDAEVPRWLQTHFNARDSAYGPALLTSNPPKKRLSFALEGTRYQAVVTLTHLKGEVMPAQ